MHFVERGKGLGIKNKEMHLASGQNNSGGWISCRSEK